MASTPENGVHTFRAWASVSRAGNEVGVLENCITWDPILCIVSRPYNPRVPPSNPDCDEDQRDDYLKTDWILIHSNGVKKQRSNQGFRVASFTDAYTEGAPAQAFAGAGSEELMRRKCPAEGGRQRGTRCVQRRQRCLSDRCRITGAEPAPEYCSVCSAPPKTTLGPGACYLAGVRQHDSSPPQETTIKMVTLAPGSSGAMGSHTSS
jgi:hypothetical protein